MRFQKLTICLKLTPKEAEPFLHLNLLLKGRDQKKGGGEGRVEEGRGGKGMNKRIQMCYVYACQNPTRNAIIMHCKHVLRKE